MKESIRPFNLENEFYIAEQCYITELSNTSDDPDVSIAQARLEPGVTTRWHRLKGIIERYYIISGTGRVEVGDLPAQTVKSGDVVLIPAMCRQRISNIGNEDLIFLAICSPQFVEEFYEDIEDSQKG